MNNLLKDKNKSCYLCFKQFNASEKENGGTVKILTTPCDHLFHRVCLRNWFRNEANENFCPHCKRSMEWRDATPLGKEATIPEHSSRTNSQSEPDVTVQSLEAEIRQRKAQEFLQKKEEAERAKFDVTDEQRAEALERRRLRREAARSAAIVEQNTKFIGKSFIILVLLGSAALPFIIFTGESVDPAQLQNDSLIPLRQRIQQGEKMWQLKLADIDRQIKYLEREAVNPNHHGKHRNILQMKKDQLMEERNGAYLMLTWHQSDLSEETLELYHDQMTELIDLANKAMDSEAAMKKFFKRDRQIFADVDEEPEEEDDDSIYVDEETGTIYFYEEE